MIALKNVLVATDFSEPSARALEYARAIARTFEASLHVIHIVESGFVQGIGPDAAAADYATLLRDMQEAARKQLDAAVGDDDRRELSAKSVLLTHHSAAAGIVSYAKDATIDLIVMGTHGRGGWAHLVMGSVAEKVVRLSPCPVLTVRYPQREFVFPDALQVVTRA